MQKIGEDEGQNFRRHGIHNLSPGITGKERENPAIATMEQASAMAMEKSGMDPMRVEFIDAVPTADHGFRMLDHRELTRAVVFGDEDLGYEFHGNRG